MSLMSRLIELLIVALISLCRGDPFNRNTLGDCCLNFIEIWQLQPVVLINIVVNQITAKMVSI